ncbi:MAG TPA: hydroxyisourate hydrolase [Rhodanobacteraceae bacterium]|nr:hydroxyisourate hydrolase [Rhodanobacteraceae bacterium]
MGQLTTHVLDTHAGKPAAGLAIHLYALDGDRRVHIKSVASNADGRVDGPLLQGDVFVAGTYELDFHAGDYFRACGLDLPEPAFLDRITIRFGISDVHAHYHVPLLLTPWSYSTYRGS